jgi:uncharacterized protein YqeY
MSQLETRIRTDLTAAMKARDELRQATLRMVLAALQTAATSGPAAHELTDEQAQAVLTSEAKRRREAATAFADAGRTEQADRDRAEGAVIAEYLPAPLTAEQVSTLVAEAITTTGAAGPAAMGQVMKLVTPQTRGRADGKAVADEVRRQLAERG